MQTPESKDWGKFIQENFDKLLLIFIFGMLLVMVLHMNHDARDSEMILWGREMCGTVLGALLGLITGHALAGRTTVTATANPPKAAAETSQ